MTEKEKLFVTEVDQAEPAITAGGELFRAVTRIITRFHRYGEMIGVDVGNETCNCAARFIRETYPDSPMAATIKAMWGLTWAPTYEKAIARLADETVAFTQSGDGLNGENKWDFTDFDEPEDREWNEEEEEQEEYTHAHPFAVYDPD